MTQSEKQRMKALVAQIILENVRVTGKFVNGEWKEKYFLGGEWLAAELIDELYSKKGGKSDEA